MANTTTGRKWTHDELVLAMNLYCRIPFGQISQRNPQIIQLAQTMSRTPSSVSMKLGNLASFDPALQARGIRGLKGASRADRAVWDEFNANWEEMGAQSEEMIQKIMPILAVPTVPTAYTGQVEGRREVKVRYAQAFFRRAVLASYGMKCCITGIPVPELLTASHILPWSKYPEHRINPFNGLCLSRTHDAAFDQRLIAFDDDYRLCLSKYLRDFLPEPEIERQFVAYEGKAMRLPEKFRPAQEFLRAHRATLI
jgi:hypothetical protein